MSKATEGQIQWMPVCAVCGSSSIFDSKYGTDDGWCDYCDDFVDSKKIDVRDYIPNTDNDQAIEENMEEAMDTQEKLNNSVTEEQVQYWVGKRDPVTFLTDLINEEDKAGFSGHGFNLGLLRTEIRNTFLFYCDESEAKKEGHCTECGVTYAEIVAEAGDIYPEARDGEDFFCVECQYEEEHDTNDENCKCQPR